MKNKAMYWYLRGKMECRNALENFMADETGASHMVEIIVVIVIVIAVAGLFWTQLEGSVGKIFESLNKFIGGE